LYFLFALAFLLALLLSSHWCYRLCWFCSCHWCYHSLVGVQCASLMLVLLLPCVVVFHCIVLLFLFVHSCLTFLMLVHCSCCLIFF
jgi:hypothetical protein